MYNTSKSIENTSTPKRRRLGTGRVANISRSVFHKNFSPVSVKKREDERCDSPPIPCNQIEYLSDSMNSSAFETSNIPKSPNVFNGSLEADNSGYSITKLVDKLSSKNNTFSSKESNSLIHSKSLQRDLDDISSDMFISKLEIENTCNIDQNNENSVKEIKSNLRQEVEESFKMVNQSICGLEPVKNETNNLFETKDSFLLDMKNTCDILEEINVENKQANVNNENDANSFYGLPLIVKSLFKSYRNIEKFYDWQEECLNLEAVRNRKNLIYALPTSGGKTLVAEVLMLREVLVRKKNALFILPFVALVQEKIWSLSPFAVQLEFLLEEYAAGKGHLPPKKRRNKNSIYIATIEKGLALIRSFLELNRLDEVGLIVVDELHLIGEAGRGSTLETLLSTVVYANKGIQIIGMSATIGNLLEIAQFLKAVVYENKFRPVELIEYVKIGNVLNRIEYGENGVELVLERELNFDYTDAARALDPDGLGGLVAEVAPAGSCLVFCPTKRNCENVATLLCKMQRREMSSHRSSERLELCAALGGEGGVDAVARRGVAYHHAGLDNDQRALVEAGFRSGVLSVLACTSTLSAGVNLPARRVIIRAPRVGRDYITLAAYRQMSGRAGRKGQCDKGESIIICSPSEWPQLKALLSSGLPPADSQLAAGWGVPQYVLAHLALGGCADRTGVRRLMAGTLLSVQADRLKIDLKEVCDNAISTLIKHGAIRLSDKDQNRQSDSSHLDDKECRIYNDSQLIVSDIGKASIKASLDLSLTSSLLGELSQCRRLVVRGPHLLYLVTPQDAAGVRPDYRHYYTLYCNLDEECQLTAKALGITEKSAIKMITGKPITNVSEKVLARFYVALILYDTWNQVPLQTVCEKYQVSRGVVQQLLSSSSSYCQAASRVCNALQQWWAFGALLAELAPRLQHCCAPELALLCDLPAVKKARAIQLYKAGFKRIEDLARATADQLVAAVDHLSRGAARHLISAARLMLIEKVENLKAEAEEVMEDLNM